MSTKNSGQEKAKRPRKAVPGTPVVPVTPVTPAASIKPAAKPETPKAKTEKAAAPRKKRAPANTAAEKPKAIAPVEEKPKAIAPVEEKPKAAAPVEEKPKAAVPVEEKPKAAAPVEEKPKAAAPVEEKPKAAASAEEKAAPAAEAEAPAQPEPEVLPPAQPAEVIAPAQPAMKVLFVAAEALPFIATGGLADVAGSLPRAEKAGADVRVVLPLYGEIPAALREGMTYVTNFYVPVSWRSQYCGVFQAEYGGVTYYLLDNEYYFKRQGIYGQYDDAERFAFFSRAALELCFHIDFKPDIIHSNDWHTALVPVFHRAFYGYTEIGGAKTVFTIHNVQYQGKYGRETLSDILGLPQWAYPQVEYDGCVNFMKGAIVTASAVTTVSPTYAQELRFPYYAYGLDRILQDCSYKFSGILNGIDTEDYDPAADRSIFKNYTADDLSGKAENKRGLQRLLGLPEDPNAMVIGMVTRLVENKGVELVKYVLEELMSHHVQLVLLGKGDWAYENYFCEMEGHFPGKLAVRIGFIQDLARKVYAGADALLMPSKTEPCGLSQMVAMRYGTVPIVRETGGLCDSVVDAGTQNGFGYTFQSFNAHDMLGAIARAEGAFANKPVWNGVMARAAHADVSWNRSAAEYLALYRRLLGR